LNKIRVFIKKIEFFKKKIKIFDKNTSFYKDSSFYQNVRVFQKKSSFSKDSSFCQKNIFKTQIPDALRRNINRNGDAFPVWDDLIPSVIESGFYCTGDLQLTCHYCDLTVRAEEFTCADDMYSEIAVDKFHIQKCRGNGFLRKISNF